MKEVYEIPFVMAAHWMISRECLLKVGGFSNTFPHYGEDCNYIHRLRYHKFNVGIAPNINVVHDREYRMESLEKQLYMVYIYNLIYLSDIRYSIWVRHITAIKYTLREVVRLKSIFPICEYFKSLSRMYFINFNNKLSKKIGSTFIN